MTSKPMDEKYMVLESLENLLIRVGASRDDAKSTGDLFQGPGVADFNATSAMIQRTKEGAARRKLLNLLQRLKQAKCLNLETKARVLHVLYTLKGSQIQPQPAAAVASLAAARVEAKRKAPPPARADPSAALGPHVMPMVKIIKRGIYRMHGVQIDDDDTATAPHSACQVAMEQLRELGELHTKVKGDLGKKADQSLLHQSLQYGIREQVQKYDEAMGELMSDVDSEERPVSLPRLLLAADRASTDLSFIRWIQLTADSSWGKGGALTSALESFSHHAAAPPGLFKSLRDVSFKPLLHMIWQWIIEGKLDDPHEEFFVARAREKDVPTDCDQWWDQKFTLRDVMFPPFVSRSLAEDILLAGKSINFLRKLCGDAYHMPPSVKNMLPNGEGLNTDNLQHLVKQAKSAVDARVLEVMFDEHRLAEHLHTAKSLCLLAQGNFFEAAYYGRVGKMLRTEVSDVLRSKYQLLPAIEECVVKTISGQIPSIDPCNFIDVSMKSNEGTGLENFQLFYNCPHPLNAVIRKELVNNYYKPVFNFIWRIRGIQKELVTGRRDMKQILHARCHRSMMKNPPDWWMKLHHCSETASHVSHAMLQFVSALVSYTLIDGVDVLWKEFETKSGKVKTLDDVVHCHSQTIIQLHRHCLLDQRYSELRSSVENVLQIVTEFLVHSSQLHHIGQDMLLRLQDAADVSKEGGRWLGPTSSSVLVIEETGLAVNQLRRKYIREVGMLLQTLDRGLDPAKLTRESTQFAHANLSPKRTALMKSRTSVPQIAMGSLQRLRTALDFNKFFAVQFDVMTAQYDEVGRDAIMDSRA